MATPEFIVSLRQKIGHEQLWLPGVSIIVVDDAGRDLRSADIHSDAQCHARAPW